MRHIQAFTGEHGGSQAPRERTLFSPRSDTVRTFPGSFRTFPQTWPCGGKPRTAVHLWRIPQLAAHFDRYAPALPYLRDKGGQV